MATATFVAAAVNALCAALAGCSRRLPASRAGRASCAADRVALRLETWRLPRDRAVGIDRARGAGGLDAAVVAAPGSVGLYVLDHSGGVSARARKSGSSAGALLARSAGSSLVMLGWCQVLAGRRHRLGCIQHRRLAALLAGRSAARRQSVADVPARSGPLALGHAAGGLSMGGELSAGARGRGAPARDSGRMVGAVYAANTVGAIVGAVGFSVVLIPTVGTLWSQRILIAAAALCRHADPAGTMRGAPPPPAAAYPSPLAHRRPDGAAAFAYGVPPVPGELYAFGRTIMSPVYVPKCFTSARA